MNSSGHGFHSLAEALRRMGLAHDADNFHFTPLTGGVSSSIVLAETARGLLCVKQALPRLKVAQEWYAPIERNQAEVAWLRVAAQIAGDCVPRILGEDRQTSSFAIAYLDPETYPVWKAQLRDGAVEVKTAREVAGILAAIHGATARRPDLAQRFAHDETFYALRLESYFVAAARAHPDVAAELHRLVKTTAETKLALVHGDVSPKNILAGPRGPVFLDAECAWYGDPAFDLAFCLNHLLLKCVWRPEHSDKYLECFREIAHSYLERVSWEPSPALETRAAALLAGLLLARIDGKSPVEYITREHDRDAVRQFAKAQLCAGPGRLDEIGKDWRRHWQRERTG